MVQISRTRSGSTSLTNLLIDADLKPRTLVSFIMALHALRHFAFFFYFIVHKSCSILLGPLSNPFLAKKNRNLHLLGILLTATFSMCSNHSIRSTWEKKKRCLPIVYKIFIFTALFPEPLQLLAVFCFENISSATHCAYTTLRQDSLLDNFLRFCIDPCLKQCILSLLQITPQKT